MQSTSRFKLTRAGEAPPLSTFAEDVQQGLDRSDKYLPCRYFYNAEGSRLFEAICNQPEYYVLRAEGEILAQQSDAIVTQVHARLARHTAEGNSGDVAIELVELGSGSAEKTTHIIEALLRRQPNLRYVPIDVSQAALEQSARQLLDSYPGLAVHALVGDYADALDALERQGTATRLVLWLGSSIGNLERDSAARFLDRIRRSMGSLATLFVGMDLRKDAATLEAAYADAQGVTAAFNLNVLKRINHELDANFDLDTFAHRAVYDKQAGRVGMYLESQRDQNVHIAALQRTIHFATGERIHTEYSHKYSPNEIEALANEAGLEVLDRWTDSKHRFMDVLLGAR